MPHVHRAVFHFARYTSDHKIRSPKSFKREILKNAHLFDTLLIYAPFVLHF